MANVHEFWLPVKGYENLYEISNLGRLKICSKYIKNKYGAHSLRKEKIVTGTTELGYKTVKLTCVNGTPKSFKVHRLVAMMFIPNPENKPYINHINGVRGDNRLENIEWCTVKENWDHAKETGLHSVDGALNPSVKLTEAQVMEIYQSSESVSVLSKRYNVSKGAVWHIKGGLSWWHLTGHKRKYRK